MTWFELVELVQNIVIVIWFLWPARYRMKGVLRDTAMESGEWGRLKALYNAMQCNQWDRSESSFQCETFPRELAYLDEKPLGAAL